MVLFIQLEDSQEGFGGHLYGTKIAHLLFARFPKV